MPLWQKVITGLQGAQEKYFALSWQKNNHKYTRK